MPDDDYSSGAKGAVGDWSAHFMREIRTLTARIEQVERDLEAARDGTHLRDALAALAETERERDKMCAKCDAMREVVEAARVSARAYAGTLLDAKANQRLRAALDRLDVQDETGDGEADGG